MSYAHNLRDTKAAFYELANVEGPKEAQKSFPNMKARTLCCWSKDFLDGKELPPHGKQRLPGGGKSPAFGPAAQEELVRKCRDHKEQFGSVPLPFAQAEAAALPKPDTDTYPHFGLASRSCLSRIFEKAGFNPNKAPTPGAPTGKARPRTDAEVDVLRASCSAHLTEVYEWRADYVERHGNDFGSEFVQTAHRLINFDEVGLKFWWDDKSMFTAMFCTSASGEILLVMVVFEGKMQPTRGVQMVDGVPFYVVYNDGHWNNQLVHLGYLEALIATLPPCDCGDPKCTSHLMIYDRFSGHFSEDIIKLFRTHKIQPCVVEMTDLAQPGDMRFHNSVKVEFQKQTTEHEVQRQRESRARVKRGEGPLQDWDSETTRQLALYKLRHIL